MPKQNKTAGKRGQRGRLRIVAGKWRSRLLEIVDGPGLRPTPERIRETLFNWLAPRLEGMRCLDLFAGTGVLGLESLSRGAASAVLVENSPRATDTLRRNIELLHADNASVIQTDAFEFLRTGCGDVFDLVFLDPPFAINASGELCRLLAESSLLAPGALVYLEEDRSRPETELPRAWRTLKSGRAGNVRYSLIKANAGQQGERS